MIVRALGRWPLIAMMLTLAACGRKAHGTSEGDAAGANDAAAPSVAHADAGGSAVAATDAGKTGPHKQCAAGQELAKILDAEECLQKCKTQADCPTKTFCTSGVLADPPGRTAKLCFKVSN